MIPPTYQTSDFTLQAYAPTDEDTFIEMALDQVTVRFMGGTSGIEAEERALFKKIFDVYKTNDQRWFWLWGIYQNQRLCGHLEMKESLHTSSEELEIVYMIHPQARKRGLMTSVLTFLKENQQNWQRRIIATVNPENIASIALLEKWGIEKRVTLIDEETHRSYLKCLLTS